MQRPAAAAAEAVRLVFDPRSARVPALQPGGRPARGAVSRDGRGPSAAQCAWSGARPSTAGPATSTCAGFSSLPPTLRKRRAWPSIRSSGRASAKRSPSTARSLTTPAASLISRRGQPAPWRKSSTTSAARSRRGCSALVEAESVGKAKNEFMQAAKQLQAKQTVRSLLISSVSPEATIIAADTAVSEAKLRFMAARQALINLGLPSTPDDFQRLAPETTMHLTEEDLANRLHFLGVPATIQAELNRETHSNNLLPLRSPVAGRIVSREIVPGEIVDPARTLFEVVDTLRVWLMLDVRAEDVAKLAVPRCKVLFKPDGQGREVEAPSPGSAPRPTRRCAR